MPIKPPPPAPKGNKYALGNKGGTPPKYNIEEERQALLEWGKHDTSLRLYGFCKERMYSSVTLNDFADRNAEFAYSLGMVKEWLAMRREEHVNDGMMNSCVYNKTAHIYDDELISRDESLKDKDMHRKMKLLEHEINLKSQAGIVYDETMLATQKALLDQLSSAQRALNKATSNIKSEP